jgi:hypothetical protein
MLLRPYRIAPLGLIVLLLLPSCAGAGSSGATDRPSRTASFSPTRTPPTRSAPTRVPGSSDSSPEATRTSAPGPSSQPAAPSSSAASGSTSSSSVESSSTSDWWWLLIPVLVLAAILGLLLKRRSGKRRTWRDQLATAEGEVGWFARDLVPQLRQTGSAAGVSGGWSVAAPRVTSLDDQLSRLVTTAPGDEDRARVIALQAAVRTARDQVNGVVAAGDANVQWSLDLDEMQTGLLAVLIPAGGGPVGPEWRG